MNIVNNINLVVKFRVYWPLITLYLDSKSKILNPSEKERGIEMFVGGFSLTVVLRGFFRSVPAGQGTGQLNLPRLHLRNRFFLALVNASANRIHPVRVDAVRWLHFR